MPLKESAHFARGISPADLDRQVGCTIELALLVADHDSPYVNGSAQADRPADSRHKSGSDGFYMAPTHFDTSHPGVFLIRDQGVGRIAAE